ncbi:aminotransferase class V-fold PLP-dependent enzyme [Flammeovirga yaeyamensis]|uniref:Aminotransferase class V-fold PLP-dependent enzyme n=1 Tax=Flammeovirga yaeyamensis TaxID=367791 RepID=A0AAX1N496_9BACT|nr:cysteine desulfurase family protein [Flammeovirga yaeyamensis]MBB3699728.1 cysteine desulfurase [Flammeovirga yaeyamensis]NMF36702.1 cysteine desulfurase [Flammeovirga yaeyamensis]QWG02254.1 aminotransferase class V-fold PLP-dependent enzyme [Flammeovirga yaeyamensis]
MSIYLDSAASTALDPQVKEAMISSMDAVFGNPSSTHAHGRASKAELEKARKMIAQNINALPSEIIFTSGGTETDNAAIKGLVHAYGLKRIITSKLEHHAVLHITEHLAQENNIELIYLDCDNKGVLDLDQLEQLLSEKGEETLVTLMHCNNEIGNILDIKRVGDLCKEAGAYFHSDTVQSVGHFPVDVKEIHVHTLAGAAHKFHGPKGAGFMYIKKGTKMPALIEGGGQEREVRSGTENVWGIVGLAKALEIATEEMDAHTAHIKEVKQHMIDLLKEHIDGVEFNGMSANLDNSLYTVLNVSFPPSPKNNMLLFALDLQGVSVSGGSACSSGASVGSHVIAGIGGASDRTSVRFSFSKYNEKAEIDTVVGKLKEILGLVEA